MLIRTLSTLMLWGLVFGTVYFFGESGGIWLLVFAAFLTQAEIYSMLTRMNQRPLRFEGLAIGATIIPFTFSWSRLSSDVNEDITWRQAAHRHQHASTDTGGILQPACYNPSVTGASAGGHTTVLLHQTREDILTFGPQNPEFTTPQK